MSVRAYLNLNAALAAGATIEGNVILPNHGPTFYFTKNEDPWIELGSVILQAKLPARLDPKLITSFSAYDNVSTGRRRMGEYRFKSASCIPSKHDSRMYAYHVRYAAERLEDLQELHRLFCEGLIWPVGDYEAEMVPPPARHLKQLLGEAGAIIRRDVSQRFRGIKA